MTKCEDCWAYYTGEHTCPPWIKALVARKKAIDDNAEAINSPPLLNKPNDTGRR